MEGMSQDEIASSIGKDPAWLSRTIKGPANWTLKTLGALTFALKGELSIEVIPTESMTEKKSCNYDAYAVGEEASLLSPEMSVPVSSRPEAAMQRNCFVIISGDGISTHHKQRYVTPLEGKKNTSGCEMGKSL